MSEVARAILVCTLASHAMIGVFFSRRHKRGPNPQKPYEFGPLTSPSGPESESGDQKSQSSSSVASALPMTYDEPDPEKKSWFSSAFGERADRIAGFTFVTVAGNIAS